MICPRNMVNPWGIPYCETPFGADLGNLQCFIAFIAYLSSVFKLVIQHQQAETLAAACECQKG